MPTHPTERSRTVDAAVGTICLIGGVALAVTVVAVRREGLWDLPLPTGAIRRNPVIMLGFALCLVFAGIKLLWQTRTVATVWSPSRPGRRFQKLVLYTKADCPLCEQAMSVLADYRQFLPALEAVDIQTDPEAQRRYAECVPVVEIDGRKRFTGQINEVLLRRMIEGAPPRSAEPAELASGGR